VEHEPQVFEINISNSCSTIEAFSGILSGFYTPGIAGRRLRLDNLNTTDFTTSQMAGVRPPVSGTTLPLLNQPEGRGPPIRRGSYEGVNRAVWDSAPPKNQTAHRGTQLGISGPYGIGSTGYDDKPHIPPTGRFPASGLHNLSHPNQRPYPTTCVWASRGTQGPEPSPPWKGPPPLAPTYPQIRMNLAWCCPTWGN
jgi:hypothetical protein